MDDAYFIKTVIVNYSYRHIGMEIYGFKSLNYAGKTFKKLS